MQMNTKLEYSEEKNQTFKTAWSNLTPEREIYYLPENMCWLKAKTMKLETKTKPVDAFVFACVYVFIYFSICCYSICKTKQRKTWHLRHTLQM